jgi:Cu(I)/Ag(I) efflux system membrane protein CusA/SilA
LGDVTSIAVTDGPSMLKSENGRLSGWVYIDVRGRDLLSVVRDLQRAVADHIRPPPGYSISWSGQFEYLERATHRLTIVVPAVLATVFVLLVVVFRRASDALIIMATLPFALVGGLWLMDLLGYDMSIASAVGFIALAGVAAEIGVVMLVYINAAIDARRTAGTLADRHGLAEAIVDGAALRVRPIMMTASVVIAGLVPIMWSSGTGSEVMRRIAAPMLGGMITALVLSMFVVPVACLLVSHLPSFESRSSTPAIRPAG